MQHHILMTALLWLPERELSVRIQRYYLNTAAGVLLFWGITLFPYGAKSFCSMNDWPHSSSQGIPKLPASVGHDQISPRDPGCAFHLLNLSAQLWPPGIWLFLTYKVNSALKLPKKGWKMMLPETLSRALLHSSFLFFNFSHLESP